MAPITTKRKYFLLSALLIAIAAIAIVQLSSVQRQPSDNTAVNQKMVRIKSFGVSSESADLNTSATGAVFAKGGEGKIEHIQIVASIEVDPDDWGGVAFYIPHGWHISDIASSYPEYEAGSEDYVATWTTAGADTKWRGWVEVGRDRTYMPTGGGSGTVVIDLVPSGNAPSRPETVNLGLEVGSKEEGGIKTTGTDWIDIRLD